MLSLNTEKLKQHLEWLETSGVIKLDPTGFTFTQEGQEICKALGYYNPTVFDVATIDKRKEELALFKDSDWETMFINFIMEAKVPARLEGSNGDVYPGNKFSVPALKVFKKAINGGTVYDILVKSTMLYYKSNVRLKKAIGNYFVSGDWLSDYQALLSSASDGTLYQHIKNETDAGTKSAWKLG